MKPPCLPLRRMSALGTSPNSLLDDNHYDAMQSAKRIIDGVTIVDETLLIPFKARAFLDLSDRAAKGEKIDSKNVKNTAPMFSGLLSFCLAAQVSSSQIRS